MLPIEFLILYPISLPIAFLMHKAWKKLTSKSELPEAQPYEFEKDQPISNFNDVTTHWKREANKMYRGVSTMKLYTEFEVRKAIELARDTHQEGKPYLEKDEYDYSVDEIVNYLLTPIELPSDDEIENYSRQSGLVHPHVSRGARWMRDKILQGGNK